MIATVVAIVTFTLIGLPLALAVIPRLNLPLLLGSSFLLGAGACALLLLVLSLSFIPWSLLDLFIWAVALGAIASLYARRRVAGAETLAGGLSPRRRVAANPIDLLTLAMIAAHGFFATWIPLWEWDYLANWGYKARVFNEFGGIDWWFLRFREYTFLQPDYPLLVPLLFDSVALFGGGWDDRSAGLLFTAFGAALVLMVRGLAAEETGSSFRQSLVTFACAGSALSPWIGLAEGPMIAYSAAALLLFRRSLRAGESLAGGAVMLGLALHTKNEGSALLLSVAFALILTTQRRWRNLLQLWPAAAIFAPWLMVRESLDFVPVYLQGNVWGRLALHLRQSGEILQALVRFAPPQRVLWLCLIVVVLWRLKWMWSRERFLLVVLLVQLVFLAGQNFLTTHPVISHIQFSWHRLMEQIAVPLIVLALLAVAAVVDGLGGAGNRKSEIGNRKSF